MDNMLPDGSICPSYLGLSSQGYGEGDGQLTNVSLRQGTVKKIVYPSDRDSRSGQYIEYRVSIDHRDGGGPGASTEYPTFQVANLFGGSTGADHFTYTLRPSANSDEAGYGVGSQVLCLCVNGDTTQGYIIGGIRDDDGKDQDLGHNLSWEFNGISAVINKDGELTLGFRGATKADGTLASGAQAGNSGTELFMGKEGQLVLRHGNQTISIDHQASGIRMTADGTTEITSAGVKLGGTAAVDALVKGTTYRTAEQTLHTQLVTALGTLSGLLTAAAAGLTTAAPLTGPGAPGLLAAAAALTGAVPAVTSMITAITSFEAQAATYLSTKNTTD